MSTANTYSEDAVSVKHVVLSEILAVTSVMRKNSRWALSTRSYSTRDSALASSLGLRRVRQDSSNQSTSRGSTEQELMAGFQDLKRLLKDVEGLQHLHGRMRTY